MDIFGVGLGEVVVIVLVILIIGGPKNAVKWSREAGRMIRQARLLIQQMMSEVEKELGPEGKEIMDATRNLTKGVNEVRSATSPRGLTGQARKLIESTVEETKAMLEEPLKETDAALKEAQRTTTPKTTKTTSKVKASESNGSKGSEETGNGKYSDWMPKK